MSRDAAKAFHELSMLNGPDTIGAETWVLLLRAFPGAASFKATAPFSYISLHRKDSAQVHTQIYVQFLLF